MKIMQLLLQIWNHWVNVHENNKNKLWACNTKINNFIEYHLDVKGLVRAVSKSSKDVTFETLFLNSILNAVQCTCMLITKWICHAKGFSSTYRLISPLFSSIFQVISSLRLFVQAGIRWYCLWFARTCSHDRISN